MQQQNTRGLARLTYGLRRIKGRVVSTVVTVGVTATSNFALAALPTVSAPSRGTTQGNYVKLAQDYLFDFFLLAGLALSAWALVKVGGSAIASYHEVTTGKKTWGDFAMHLGVGVGLLVFIVFLANQASNIL